MFFVVDDKSWRVLKSFNFRDKLYAVDVTLQFLDYGEGIRGGRVDYMEKENGEDRFAISLSDPRCLSVLVHECLHLVKGIFRERGIPFTAENDEAIAYYQEWWFEKLWQKCCDEIGKEEKKET